jgi:parallel beta-helix repeat protein
MTPKRLYQGDDGSIGGVDDEAVVVPASALSNFFITQSKRIADGDTLVINFQTAKDRRTSDAATSLPWTMLQLVSEDSRNTADDLGIIPVCKRFGPALYFLNGRMIALGDVDYIVNSKQQSDDLRTELADQTGTPYGDHMIGCESKTSTNLTLAQGTLNEQLDTLASLGDQASGTSGSTKIGCRERTGTIRSLAAESLDGQIDDLHAWYNNHTYNGNSDRHDDEAIDCVAKAGSPHSWSGFGHVDTFLTNFLGWFNDHANGTGDKHGPQDLTGIPIKFVDPTPGAADYTTIQDALNAVGATDGATIFVKGDVTYAESLTFPYLQKPLTLVGHGGIVNVDPVTPNPAFTFNGAISEGRITIVNFQMVNGEATIPHYVDFDGDNTSPQSWITFKQCVLGRSAALANHIFEVDADVSLRLEDCYLTGYATNTSGAATDPYMIVKTGAEPRIEILNCYIDDCSRVLEYEDHGGTTGNTKSLGKLVFRGNRIRECGYNKNDGTVCTSLIRQLNVDYDYFEACQIIGNEWWESYSLPSVNSGGFCAVGGNVVVSNNVLDRPYQYAPDSAVGYPRTLIVAVGGEDAAQGAIISNNKIRLGKGSAISVAYGSIENNVISNVQTQHDVTALAVVHMNKGIVANNRIMCSTISAPTADVTLNTLSECTVTGNMIYDTPSGSSAIKITDQCTVTGNMIYSASGTGVEIAGEHTAVSGNTIRGCVTGISTDQPYCAISGNVIYIGTTAIDLASGATRNSISGNTIYDATGVSGNAILLASGADYNTIVGNTAYDPAVGIDVSSDHNTVVGNNMFDMAAGIRFNVGGDNNCCCGNRTGTTPGLVDNGANNGVNFESGAGYSMKYNHPGI